MFLKMFMSQVSTPPAFIPPTTCKILVSDDGMCFNLPHGIEVADQGSNGLNQHRGTVCPRGSQQTMSRDQDITSQGTHGSGRREEYGLDPKHPCRRQAVAEDGGNIAKDKCRHEPNQQVCLCPVFGSVEDGQDLAPVEVCRRTPSRAPSAAVTPLPLLAFKRDKRSSISAPERGSTVS